MLCIANNSIKHKSFADTQLYCSTMGVGRQSRRVCFGAKPDKGFLDLKSRRTRKWYGEANESWRRAQERVGGWTGEKAVAAGAQGRELVAGEQSWWLDDLGGVETGQERGEQQKLAWKNGGAVNTRHRAERRGDKIGSSEEESQDVWFQ